MALQHLASCAFSTARGSIHAAAVGLLRSSHEHSNACPCHSHAGARAASQHYSAPFSAGPTGTASLITPPLSPLLPDSDYAFETSASTVRFGRGCTSEVGADCVNMGARRVVVVTDATVRDLLPCRRVLESLDRAGVRYALFDRVRVEPTDASFREAIAIARAQSQVDGGIDAYIGVGGGSAIDTAKAANLYTCFPQHDFLDFVNAPVGKGMAVPGPLKKLIAIPTTAGTGSETTGVAIFDMESLKAKTGIGSKMLRPTLGLVDADNTRSMPFGVAVASGFDVLCHALESYTALPYNMRAPRPTDPSLRPAYQGSNPISDVWCLAALRSMSTYFVRSALDAGDDEAREAMLLASTMAGIGFGSAGVHLCHGMSYAVSGRNKEAPAARYQHTDYTHLRRPLIPHGISVCLTAPAVFRLTAHASPRRHAEAARALGVDVPTAREADADYVGRALGDRILQLMQTLRVPLGLAACGFGAADLPALVAGTLPQARITRLAHIKNQEAVDAALLEELFRQSMKY